MPEPKCPDCGGTGYVLDRTGARSRAAACACVDDCRTCSGTGHILAQRDGYSFARPCSCQTVHQRVARFNEAGLPARGGLSFEDFVPDADKLEYALRVAESTAKLYKAGAPSRGFLISGPVGSGKTHLLCAALRYLTLESGVRCRYVEMSFLFSEIRRGFSEGRSGLDAIEPLVSADVLAIDELGKGKGSPFELDTLDELIARRYNTNRTTLFGTNFSLEEQRARPTTHFDPQEQASERPMDVPLRERVGERVWSRLSEMCHQVKLPPSIPDHRRRDSLAR